MAASMFADTCEFAAVGDTVTLDRTGVPRQLRPPCHPERQASSTCRFAQPR